MKEYFVSDVLIDDENGMRKHKVQIIAGPLTEVDSFSFVSIAKEIVEAYEFAHPDAIETALTQNGRLYAIEKTLESVKILAFPDLRDIIAHAVY